MKRLGWVERKKSNWLRLKGGHEREAINNDLVYTGRAVTLGNAGQSHQKSGSRFLRADFVDAHILGEQNIQIVFGWKSSDI